MANGSTAHEHIDAIKKHIDHLEVSPSHHSATSPIGHGGTRAVAHGKHAEHTAVLKHGSTRPKPRGSKISGAKKHMMAQKSHGR
jgi:hypothetical protein